MKTRGTYIHVHDGNVCVHMDGTVLTLLPASAMAFSTALAFWARRADPSVQPVSDEQLKAMALTHEQAQLLNAEPEGRS